MPSRCSRKTTRAATPSPPRGSIRSSGTGIRASPPSARPISMRPGPGPRSRHCLPINGPMAWSRTSSSTSIRMAISRVPTSGAPIDRLRPPASPSRPWQASPSGACSSALATAPSRSARHVNSCPGSTNGTTGSIATATRRAKGWSPFFTHGRPDETIQWIGTKPSNASRQRASRPIRAATPSTPIPPIARPRPSMIAICGWSKNSVPSSGTMPGSTMPRPSRSSTRASTPY
ncbi:hypothetical protein D3C87_1535580 [compost metagenome]